MSSAPPPGSPAPPHSPGTDPGQSELGEGLIRAMTPVTERAIHHSIQLNPSILAETLFPIMGTAVRKSIAHALEKMMQTLNSAVEHSLSPQSIKWRIEAKRTGRSF